MTFLPFILIRDGGLPASVLPPMRTVWPPDLVATEQEQQAARESLFAALDHCLQRLADGPARTAVYNQRKRLHQGKSFQWQHLALFSEVQADLKAAYQNDLDKQHAYQTAIENAKSIWQKQYQAAKDWVIDQLQNSTPLRRGLVATGSELIHSHSQDDLDKYCRAIYAYLTRASVKTSPHSTLGTVDFIHDRFGTAMPWEDTVERFWPSLQLREPFYWSVQAYQIWQEHLTFRINPSLTASTQGTFQWLRYTASGESIAHAPATQELEQLAAMLSTPTAMTLVAWQKSALNTSSAWLQSAIEAEILVPVLPEAGLDGSWAKRLMNHLAFLGPQAPQAEISMLNLLTKAATQFPHMPPDALQAGLAEVRSHLMRTGAEVQFDLSELRPSDLYSHDVHIKRDRNLQTTDFAPIATEITQAMRALPGIPLDREHARMRAFALKTRLRKIQVASGQPVWPFLSFAQAYLKSKVATARLATERAYAAWHGRWPVSAVTQCYRDSSGQMAAVLNGLSPGGGRLVGRFLPMFPEQITTEFVQFNEQVGDEETIPVGFRQISPSNANLHPALTLQSIDWPDAATGSTPQGAIPLHAIGVRLNDYDMLELVHLSTGQSLRVLEFGLEARHEKPKLAQLFLSIGVPDWTTALWEAQPMALTESVQFRPTVTSGSITLQRRSWDCQIAPHWLRFDGFTFHRALQQWAREMALPTELFYTTAAQPKPQYLHIEEPLSTELLRSNLKKAKTNQVRLTEMLPNKEQALGAPYVSEYVLELQI